ncbi:hypothetical protein RRG08_002359 [Elysia crispata]|uniref:Uncharacterized protein n=1 Tax=Elysia crispata TaxID=231223 RepID=A0AAE1DND8_9GAST|nr:hypothetical protein RRG08_002359 [Elysia crispata]
MWLQPPEKKFYMFDNTLSFHSERRNFRGKCPDESSTLAIQDVILVSERLMLLADSRNQSVRLFNEQKGDLEPIHPPLVPGVSLGDKLLGPQPTGGVPGVSLGDKLLGPQLAAGGVPGVSLGDKLLGPQPTGGVPGVSLGDKLLGPQPTGGGPWGILRGQTTRAAIRRWWGPWGILRGQTTRAATRRWWGPWGILRGQTTRAATRRWWGPWGDKLPGPQPAAGGVPGVSLGDKTTRGRNPPLVGVPGVSLGDKLLGPQPAAGGGPWGILRGQTTRAAIRRWWGPWGILRGQTTRAATRRWWGPWGDKLLGPQSAAGGVPGVSLGDKLPGPQPAAGGVPGVSLGDKLLGPQSAAGGVPGVSLGDKLLGPQSTAGGVPGVSLGDKLLGPQPAAGGVPGGDHLHSLKLCSYPRRLAFIDSGPGNTWKVAVTLPSDQIIAILEVTPDSVALLTSIQKSGWCWALTAVDSATLAVGYYDVSGIDLIDMTGRVLRRLSQTLNPDYMTVTQDGCLFMSTMNNLAKVKIHDGKIIFHKAVPVIKITAGVATLQDGWFVVSDNDTRSLHLVTPDGRWYRQLWRHPRGSSYMNEPRCVSISGSVCVAVTSDGETHVFDIS